jgi:predicted DNA-binding protein (MmcQ/YjbR family)
MADDDPRLARLTALCLSLPGAEREVQHGHGIFRLRGKVFAYFLNNHHGDGIVGVTCKTALAENVDRVARDPERYYLPAYNGKRGWVGIRLDRGAVDWRDVESAVRVSYSLTAPKALALQLDGLPPTEPAARATAAPAGYSGTPLAGKLGLKPGMAVHVAGEPEGYRGWLAPLPAGLRFLPRLSAEAALVHLFTDSRAELAKALQRCRETLAADAMVWVSWPKKSSKVPTDITEDTIRELALPLGWVDVKVCAVSEVWSGLKLVVRKGLRRPAQ